MSDVVGQPRPLNGLRGLVDLAHHAGRFLRGFHRQTERLAYDASGNRARRNTVDANAGFAEFHRDAFRQMNHGGLCGPVHHGGGKAGKPSRDAAIVDDAAGALATHMRGGVLHAEHDTAHQCRHGGIELWDFQPFNAAGLCGPAGIIKQAIDAAEFLNRTADQRAHLLLDGDIGAPENTVAPSFFARASPSGARRPATTTLAPSATNISAVRRPMPLVAPVITATLPLSRSILVSSEDADAIICGPLELRNPWCASPSAIFSPRIRLAGPE